MRMECGKKIGSEKCPMADFGINSREPSGYTFREYFLSVE
jgi:hypothetical protein